MTRSHACRSSVPVSVIVPVYNAASTVGRALDSVLRQTASAAEVIFVDDGSTDFSASIIEGESRRHPDANIRLIRTGTNRGAGAARNAGWEAAKGQYIAFLDADDSWHSQKLERQYNWMERHPDVSVTGHPCIVARAEDAEADVSPETSARPITAAWLLRSNRFSTPSAMLRRDIPHRFDPDKRYAEDYLLWLRIVLSGGSAYLLDTPLAFLHKARYGAGGLSAELWNMEQGVLDAYRRLYRERLISLPAYAALMSYSLAKYARRLVLSKLRAA